MHLPLFLMFVPLDIVYKARQNSANLALGLAFASPYAYSPRSPVRSLRPRIRWNHRSTRLSWAQHRDCNRDCNRHSCMRKDKHDTFDLALLPYQIVSARFVPLRHCDLGIRFGGKHQRKASDLNVCGSEDSGRNRSFWCSLEPVGLARNSIGDTHLWSSQW